MKKICLFNENKRLAAKIAVSRLHTVRSTEDKEDIFQDAYIGLMMAAEHYDETKGIKFSTYAYRVIQRKLNEETNRKQMEMGNIHIWRSSKVGSRPDLKPVLIGENLMRTIEYDEDMDKEISLKRNRELLLKYINRLPEDIRIVLELSFGLNDTWRVYTQKEIAKMFNCTQPAIYAKRKKGIKMLRRFLEREGVLDVYA